MNPLLKDIEDELKRTRLDKGRLYSILTKIVQECSGGSGGVGPAGPAGPAGPRGATGVTGPTGPAATVTAEPVATPATVTTTPAKKTVPKKKAPTTA